MWPWVSARFSVLWALGQTFNILFYIQEPLRLHSLTMKQHIPTEADPIRDARQPLPKTTWFLFTYVSNR